MITDIDFIIPIFNEEKRVNKVENWLDWMNKNTIDSSLILSLNGCTDNTEEKLKKFSHNNKIKILKDYEKGRGVAVINAVNKSKKKYLAIGSIDDAWDKNFYINAFKELNQDESLFCVYGPKDHVDSIQNRVVIRKIISFFSKIFLRIVFFNKINQDTQCIKLFRQNEKFNRNLRKYNYFFDTYFFLLNKDLKLKFKNISISVKDNNKNSKVNFSSMLEFVFDALIYIIKKPKIF